jgi:YidC/Oxa1 family membrane protein insertase
MNPFLWIFDTFVYRPEVNILKFFYNITGDIGVSILLLAIVVNLMLWPLFIATYLNSQKMRYLQPQLKALQTKYKDNQQEMIRQLQAFNKKHGVNNGTFLWVIVCQILVATGLWTITNNLSGAQNGGSVSINGLYEWIFSSQTAVFNTKAFGFLDISKSANTFIALPILNSIFSFLYGMYSFKWAPKLPDVPKPIEKKSVKTDDKKPAFDVEAFQKSMEFQTIYFMPAFLFFINLSFPIGVNIYFATVSLMSLIRQIYITQFYTSHTLKFVEDLAKTDPEFDSPTLELEETATPAKELAKDKTNRKIDTKKKAKVTKPAKKSPKKKTAKK